MPIVVTTSGPISTVSPDTTYSGLITMVGKYLARRDVAQLVPGWITQAEDILNYGMDPMPPLRCREMEVETTIEITNGEAVLPDDFLEVKRFKDVNSNRLPLTFITEDEATRRYPDGAGGVAINYTVIGESVYVLPASTGTFSLSFYQRIPTLSDAHPSNWLLDKNHAIYLHLALSVGFDFLRNDAQATKHLQAAISLVNGMNRSQMMAQYGRAGLTLRGPTP